MEVRPDPEATAPELDPVPEVDIAAIEAAALVPSISEIAEVEETRGLLLSAHGVMKRFGGLVAVHDVDFTIPEGSIVSLIGPNGAGKTTFFNIIAGIYDPTSGKIAFRGTDMIARARRAWIEPVLWLAIPAVLGLLTLVLAESGLVDEGIVGLGILATVLALMTA